MTTPASGKDELDKILAALAEGLINYDKRMYEAGAPNIRFVHKYTSKAKAALLKWRDASTQQAVQKAYDDGYEAGEKPHLPSLIDAIDFRREQYGWNDSEMAAMLDLSKEHYSEFKSGKRGLPINSVRKAYAIGIPASVLLAERLTAAPVGRSKKI